MKKLIILLLPLLLTGCFGETGRGNLSSNCTINETYNSFSSDTIYDIKFKNNNITEIVITKNHQALDKTAKETLRLTKISVDDYNNYMEKMNGVTVKVITNDDMNYVVSYNIDMTLINNADINELELSKKHSELTTKLKDKGLACK